MVWRALAAGFCLLTVTCGGASQASSRVLERTSLPAVDAASAPSALLASLEPVRLVIPRIAVDARIEARGLDANRSLDVPADYRDVAWSNLGPAPGQPDDATRVVVTDVVPAGVTLITATPSQGTYTAGTGQWAIGNLADGASATLRLRVRVNLTTKVTNTAVTAGSTPADFDPANNRASSSSVTGSTIPGLPNNGVPESTSSASATRTGWGGVIAAGSLLLVVVVALITAAKRRKI